MRHHKSTVSSLRQELLSEARREPKLKPPAVGGHKTATAAAAAAEKQKEQVHIPPEKGTVALKSAKGLVERVHLQFTFEERVLDGR